jgi:hypothetical protein
MREFADLEERKDGYTSSYVLALLGDAPGKLRAFGHARIECEAAMD